MVEEKAGSSISDAVIGFVFWSCLLLARMVMVAFALAVGQIGAVPLGLAVAVLGPLVFPLSIVLLYWGDKKFFIRKNNYE